MRRRCLRALKPQSAPPRIGLGPANWPGSKPSTLSASLHCTGADPTAIGGLCRIASSRCDTLLIGTEPLTHNLPINRRREALPIARSTASGTEPPHRTSPPPVILPPQLALALRKGNSAAGPPERSDRSDSAKERFLTIGSTQTSSRLALKTQKAMYVSGGCDMNPRYR